MRKLLVVLMGLLLALVMLPTSAYAAVSNVTVTKAEYHRYVQDALSECGLSWDNPSSNQYQAPKPPAEVLNAIANDTPGGKWYYPSGTPKEMSKYLEGLTGNGLPQVVWRAENADRVDLFIPHMNTTVQIKVWETRYHAWVPGFAGNSCNTWVRLEYVS